MGGQYLRGEVVKRMDTTIDGHIAPSASNDSDSAGTVDFVSSDKRPELTKGKSVALM